MKIRNIFNAFNSFPLNHAVPHSYEWPEPEPLRTSLSSVKPLSTSSIPEPFRDWVCDVSDRMQCPPDFIAVAAMVMTSSIVGTACGIKPKSMDDWLVIPNLWGGIVGRPGMLKTPAVSEVMQIIHQLEKKAKKSYEEELPDYLTSLEVYKSEKDAIKSALLSAHKQGLKNKSQKNSYDALTIKDQLSKLNEPRKPIWKRYKTNDTTIEKLSELLTENPRGLLLYRDELIGLLSGWDRDGHETDRAFYLEAWNGDGSLTTDRINRGTVNTENLCLSIFGSTQPAKLSRYLYRAIRGSDNDGLLQRFQLLIYPDEREDWKLIDRLPNNHARERVVDVIHKLAEVNFIEYGATQSAGDRFPYYRFDPEAQDIFNEWLVSLEKTKLRKDEHPILIEHLAKFRSLFPSLALIFHLINVVDGKQNRHVSTECVYSALSWCGYLESHARRIYGMLNTVAHQAAIKLGTKINEGELLSPFSIRDIYRKEWTFLDDKEVVQKACDELIDAGWIRLEQTHNEMGRPKSPHFTVNPKLKIHSHTDENFF